MASEAVTNRSTWRYFQRENELVLRWKSTRRAATRAGRVGGRRDREGRGRRGHAVRVVGVHDIGLEIADDPRQPPRGGHVHFVSSGERHDLHVGGQAAAQFAVGVADHDHAMAAGTEPASGQQDLVLAASPTARRVDLK